MLKYTCFLYLINNFLIVILRHLVSIHKIKSQLVNSSTNNTLNYNILSDILIDIDYNCFSIAE